MGEGEGQTHEPGQLGAVAARPEQPHRRVLALGGHGRDGPVAAEVGEQLAELLGEVVGAQRGGAPAQGACGALIRAGGTADTEVDPPGVQRVERAELLGDDERLVVGQHHTARADPDALRHGGQVGDQDGGCRARDTGHPVVLGDPVPPEAELLGEPHQLRAGGERGRRGRVRADGGEVENGEWHHVAGNAGTHRALPGDHPPCTLRVDLVHASTDPGCAAPGGVPATAQRGRGVTIW